MPLKGIHARRRLMVFGAVAVVAIVAAACLPPKPAPVPAAPTTTKAPVTTTTTKAPVTTTTTKAPVTTTTTKPPPPSICGVTAASAGPAAADAPDDGAATANPNRYTAVVKRAGRSKVLTRDVSNPAEIAQFRADAAAQGEVLAFAPDGEVRATAETPTWGFVDSKFATAWTQPTPTKGAGVRVAELDTGIDTVHEDLTGHFDATPGADIVGAIDVNNPPPDTTDPSTSGHGTHVAGIVAATDSNGLGVEGGAPGVTLVPVRVLGTGGSGSYSNVAAGLLWAAGVGSTKGRAQVITMSLGGSDDGGIVGAALATIEDPTNPLYTHPVVTIAAGNTPACLAPAYPAIYGGTNPYQAPLTQVLAVSALCKPGGTSLCPSANPWPADGWRLATYSKLAWNGVGDPAGITAPGTEINSTLPGNTYGSLSGTSMATPFVAAAAALVIAHCPPTETASQVVARLENSSHDLGPAGPDKLYGYGMLDADNAVKAC